MPHFHVRNGAWRGAMLIASVCAFLAGCAAVSTPRSASPSATVERLEVVERKPAYGGQRFGEVGEYELVTAVAHMKADPRAPSNQAVVDLAAAADADGMVRYRTNVVMLRPRDAAKASKALLFEAANRGNKLLLAFAHEGGVQADAAASDAGTGWAMANGHTLVWVGWQGNIALARDSKTVGMQLPVATRSGVPITGPVIEEITFDAPGNSGKLALQYPAANVGAGDARLTVHARPGAPVTVLPASSWRFLSPAQIEFTRPAAFDAGAIYQFSYVAKDPRPYGLGMAAIRDVVSFLRQGLNDGSGQAHPLADIPFNVSTALGISQSGRFMRDFIWEGFNAAPGGGKVFDGVLPTIAGSRKSFTNVRFAQPGRYSRQHEDHEVYGDQFPFSYGVSTDALTGRTDGIFSRCRKDDTCPKLFHMDSSLEFWQARASLVVTDARGGELAVPDDVRVYLMASTQHASAATPTAGICELPNNPASQGSTYRAMMARLITWARDGQSPPPSRYPSVADGTLVAPQRAAMGFPDLSALGLNLPQQANELFVTDHSGAEPAPNPAKRYTVLVARTDADGNDAVGIRAPDVAVPLATFTGFNLRKAGFAPGQLCGLNGSYLPLAKDANERQARRDPRVSLAERYGSRDQYLQRVRQAAEQLSAAGYMLPEDVARSVELAGKNAWPLPR